MIALYRLSAKLAQHKGFGIQIVMVGYRKADKDREQERLK